MESVVVVVVVVDFVSFLVAMKQMAAPADWTISVGAMGSADRIRRARHWPVSGKCPLIGARSINQVAASDDVTNGSRIDPVGREMCKAVFFFFFFFFFEISW